MSKHSATSIFNPKDYISDKPITAPERKTLDKLLTKTKVQLFYLNGSGFVASLVATLEFKWDRTIPTACTNGVFMAWNPEFFLSLTPQTRVTVLAHEAWHVAFQHMGRCEGRDPREYNDAADFVINGMLKDHGFDMSGFPFLVDDKYRGMSTEEVYNQIHVDKEENNNALNGDFAAPGSGPPSLTGGMSPSQIQSKALSNVVKASTIAKMNSGKGIGNLPGEVQSILDSFLAPKLSWQTILLNFFEAMTNVEYSYRRTNRRYEDPILPGRSGASGLEHLIYYLDISGSISDKEIQRFNSEVKYIKDTYNPEKLTLVTFDTELQDFYVFEQDDEFEKIVVTGRGGTDLTKVYEHAKEQAPTAMVIFTDLCVRIPDKAPDCPLIWIVSGNDSATVPYGTLVNIELD